MDWARQLWMRLQTLFRRDHLTQDLDDEVRFHLDEQIAENIAAGMNKEEARHTALRIFGNPSLLKEDVREAWGWVWLEQIGQDLRYGLRSRRWLFTRAQQGRLDGSYAAWHAFLAENNEHAEICQRLRQQSAVQLSQEPFNQVVTP